MDAEICTECGSEVKTMAFRKTGVCSESCRKDRDNDHEQARAFTDAGITNILKQPNGINPKEIR